MSCYAVMHPLEGMEQMAQSQWTAMLRKLGHQVEVHALRSPHEDPRANLPGFISRVLKNSPEIIFVEGAIGFNVPEFYLHPEIRRVPVAAFWFDAPIRPVDYRRREPGWLDAWRLPNVHHFVWDGYWRRWLAQRHGIRSFPIHLAADAEEFHPLPQPPEYREHAVFIGTLVSPQHVEEQKARLPPVLQRIARALPSAIARAAYGANPFQLLDNVIAGMPSKINVAFQTLEEAQPEEVLRLRSVAWMLAKNETRLRILRGALEVGPLLMLCGNFEQTHASGGQVRSMLRKGGKRLVVRDTRGLETAALGDLYAHGRIHIQATDPQSVEGGIPFRVFQTTACRRPLLTDPRPELAECYACGQEILIFESEKDFPSALQRALAEAGTLDAIAQAGHERFRKEHTWEHRFGHVTRTIASARAGSGG